MPSSTLIWRSWLLLNIGTLAASQGLCPALIVPRRAVLTCHNDKDQDISCSGDTSPEGTVATLTCKPWYLPDSYDPVVCLNGQWTGRLPNCVAECGKINHGLPLIVNGEAAVVGAYPWHAALYNFMGDKWEFWCGGSLVSETIIITAAHCAWKVEPAKLTVILGKYHRDYNKTDEYEQRIKVSRIEMLHSYQDLSGNYNGDIAALFLESPAHFTTWVRPVCIDYNQDHVDILIQQGKKGVVLGWGLTETDTFPDTLKLAFLPLQSDDACLQSQQRDFRKFLTYTSFCAGYGNGTGVCNGDSGGGLSIEDEATSTWYLEGVVSVSPRRSGTAFCDPHYATVFTKLAVFATWLQRMKTIEEEMQIAEVQSDPVVNLNPVLDVLLQKQNVS